MAFNLKTIFSSDTSDLKKGAAEAKQAVKDFDASTESALDHVAGLFGVSMKEINTTLSAMKGGFLSLKGAMGGATAASNLFSKAMKVLKVALVSTGIGAIVVALGSLVAYFTKSQRGADALSRVMGQVGQVFKTVTDYAVKLGESIVYAVTHPVEAVKKIWKTLTTKEGWKSMGDAINEAGKDFDERQQRRLQLTKGQQKLEQDLISWTTQRAELETKIEQQREIAADKTGHTAQERLNANLKAQELIGQMFATEKEYAQEKLRLITEENALSESMRTDLQAEADAKAEMITTEKQRASMMKEIVAQQAEITNQVIAEVKARERVAALAQAKADMTLLPKIDSSKLLDQKVEGPAIDLDLKKGKEELEEFTLDLEGIAEGFATTVSNAFGQMIAGLITGDVNMKEIFGSILGFLGEVLKQIGSALIAYGTAMEAFKAAFSNPYLAIAAGAALMVAGSVLSSLVGTMVEGGRGAASSGSTALASGSSLNLATPSGMSVAPQEIKISGTLQAKGKDLVAVIDNENKRKNLSA